MVGQPAHELTIRTISQMELDINSHRGHQVTESMALRADLILVMDKFQREACEILVPSARGRVFLLGHWLPNAEQEINDPIGGGSSEHCACYDHILRAVQTWLPRLKPQNRRMP